MSRCYCQPRNGRYSGGGGAEQRVLIDRGRRVFINAVAVAIVTHREGTKASFGLYERALVCVHVRVQRGVSIY